MFASETREVAMVLFTPSQVLAVLRPPPSPYRSPRVAHDPLAWILMGAVVLTAALLVGGLAVAYYLDQVAVPSWDEQAVPPPLLY
ncbi:MAG: hypothetical protein AB7Q16_16240 [Vicinamibacterales bacterium]